MKECMRRDCHNPTPGGYTGHYLCRPCYERNRDAIFSTWRKIQDEKAINQLIRESGCVPPEDAE